MTDDLDVRLNGSSPRITTSLSLDSELTDLAYATQRLARIRRGSRFRTIGISLLVGVMALGGTGVAFASPDIQRSLGIAAPTPSANPAPPVVTLPTLPFPNCRLTFTVAYGSTSHETARDAASIAAAKQYLDAFDQSALINDAPFIAEYGQQVAGADHADAQSTSRSEVLTQMSATEEIYGISDSAMSGLAKYLKSENLSPMPLNITSSASNCGENE